MSFAVPKTATSRGSAPKGADLWLLAATIFLANLPLASGRIAGALIFRLDAVLAGEWWRWFTHPFVHVSFYHALLDASAFLSLYAILPRRSRPWLAMAAAMGSLAAACAVPGVMREGFCGLSGIAHGLMAAVAVEFIRSTDRINRRAGVVALALVVGKSVIEAATGSVLFTDWHFGQLGTPVAACHLGGVIGALCMAVGASLAMPDNRDLRASIAKPLRLRHTA